jgi:hypothetical protein
MRVPIRLCTVLGVLLALLAPCAAHADITPIPKPPENTGGPGVSEPSAIVAPLPKPQVESPQAPSTPPETPILARVSEPDPALSEGGRELPVAAESSEGGRADAAPRRTLLATLQPMPLALVGVGESLSSYETYPAWLLGLFTLMASTEAFLLTHLVRSRRAAVAETNDLDDLNRL